jgi:CBS domain-containing protein
MVIDGKTTTIEEIMRQPVTIGNDATLHDVLKKMIAQKTNSLLVVDEDEKLVGIVNAGSVIARVIPDYLEDDTIAARFATEEMFKEEVNKSRDVSVTEFMNEQPNTVKVGSSIMEAAIFALSKKQVRVPVVNDEYKVVGLLTRTEFKQVIGHYMGIDESFK